MTDRTTAGEPSTEECPSCDDSWAAHVAGLHEETDEGLVRAAIPPALDVERLAEALNRHSARNSIDGHDWNSCEASCSPRIAAEYARLSPVGRE